MNVERNYVCQPLANANVQIGTGGVNSWGGGGLKWEPGRGLVC